MNLSLEGLSQLPIRYSNRVVRQRVDDDNASKITFSYRYFRLLTRDEDLWIRHCYFLMITTSNSYVVTIGEFTLYR